MAEGVMTVTEDTFQSEVLEADVPVVVDLWAEWCGPCHMVSPVLEELAEEYDERVRFAKIDVDSNSSIAVQFGIMSIPTVMLFKDGEAVDKMIGARGKGDYKAWIDSKI